MTRIAVVDVGTTAWTGGGAYAVVSAQSLVAATTPGDEVMWVGRRPDHSPAGTAAVPVADVQQLPGERALRRRLGLTDRALTFPGESRLRRTAHLPQPHDPVWVAARKGADVVFPVTAMSQPASGTMAYVGWIPDFQHVTNAEHFSVTEIAARDQASRLLARNAHVVVLSSEAALAEFVRFSPEYADKARVLRFPSRYAFDDVDDLLDPSETAKRYHVPERYLLCANQFWTHKNHVMLVEAVALLAKEGMRVPVVMTGMLADYRDPSNSLVSTMLQIVATSGVHDLVRVLGLVPRADLEGLLRNAAGVVQPSASEGWNTTVQDALALGRPLICSDLPVHREQAPDAEFFDLTASGLATAIRRMWADGTARSKPLEDSLEDERLRARQHGSALMRACRDAVERARR